MNKTVTINLSGIVFHIDEDAYLELSNYILAIKKSLKNTEGGDEIIADIEARIAEIFKEKLAQNNVQVINIPDVKDVIAIMGKPEEYIETDAKQESKVEENANIENETFYTSQKRMYRDKDHNVIGGVCSGLGAYFNLDPIVFRVLFGISIFIGVGTLLYIFLWIAIPVAKTEDDKKKMRGEFKTHGSKKIYSSYNESTGKRLFRDSDDKVLGGVCSGLGSYFGVDPIIFRLAFVVAFFGFGTGLLLYLILVLILPKAVTTADRLRMKGEPININNIQKTFTEEFDDLKKKAKDFSNEAKDLGKPENQNRVKTFIQDLFELVMQAIGGFFRVAGKILGVLLLIAGLLGFITLIFFLTGIGGPHTGIIDHGHKISFLSFHHYIIGSNYSALSVIGVVLLIGIPILTVLLTGIKLLFKLNTPTKQISVVMGILWLVGLGICTYKGALVAEDFSVRGKDNQKVFLQDISSDTLYLDVDVEKNSLSHHKIYRINGRDILEFNDLAIGMYEVFLDIRKSDDTTTSLYVTRTAYGSNREEAKTRASKIIYNTQQKDSLLLFDNYFILPENEVWRKHEVYVILNIPVGKTVYLSSRMKKIIYDIENVTDTYDSKMVQHYWTMKPEGLTCVDTDFSKVTSRNQHENAHGDDMKFEFADFSELEIHGNFTVNIIKGDKYDVSLSGDTDDLEEVGLVLDENELTIKTDKDGVLSILDGPITINITTPHLTRLELRGSSSSTVKGFTENEMQMKLSGANEINLSNLEIQNLNIDMSGSSKLSISGHGNRLKTELSGVSSFNGLEYAVREAEIEMSGAGKAKVNATEKLDADVSGACSLKYAGNPSVINKDVSSLAASVEKL